MKLKNDLFGVAMGEVYPRVFAAGEECPPELLDAARSLDALETDADGSAGAKAVTPAENKALRPAETK